MKQSLHGKEPQAKVCRVSSFEHPEVPRLFAHFLPKFENQQQERLLSGSSLAGARCLAIAKKHSGHLVMAPPFYSKNGCANIYSRLGEVVLRAHFDAVWPDETDAFERWWQHAHEHSLSYSFECVVPRIAGDHGATPRAAYMVLTCVAQAGGFLSPAQLLSLGASWRLPLNQVSYVPWELAPALETELHRSRWTLDDSGADALLAGCGAQQCFLRHSDTQGEVLEGFVLFALDQPLEALAPLVEAYEAAVASHRAAALEAALRLGESCFHREGWLLDRLAQPSAREPSRAVLSQAQAWQLACDSADGPLARLFRTLRAAYTHRVVLKQYEYMGKLQLQIDVHDDQIFFGWPLHEALQGCAPLYRGMVVQFEAKLMADAQPPPLAAALAGVAGAGALPLRILGIAKLKCLPYLLRTFGVRNLLPTLLAEGAMAYLQRTSKFFNNWQVPEAHRPALAETFSGWARQVELLSPAERQQLQQGGYLQFLEPYLRGEHRKEEDTELRNLSAYALLVIDLSGGALTPQLLSQYTAGMLHVTGGARGATGELMRGTVRVLVTPPPPRLVRGGAPALLLVFPPAPQAEPRWHKMWQACLLLERRIPELSGRCFVHPQPDEWRSILRALPPPLPFLSGGGASEGAPSGVLTSGAMTEAPPAVRHLVAVAALPPGGGKSSLFAALRSTGWEVASSDEQRARGRSFDEALVQALRKHSRVGFDKNLPNAEGVVKLCKVVSHAAARYGWRVRVLLLVPGHLERETAWQRVAARPADDIALNVHTCEGGARGARRIFDSIFFDACAAFLPATHALPGVLVTDAFWQGLEAVRELAAQVETKVTEAPELPQLSHALSLASSDAQRSLGGLAGQHCWYSAELLGTNLHVTLVPPGGGNRGAHEAREEHARVVRALLTLQGQSITLSLERYFVAHHEVEKKRIAFWTVTGLPPHLCLGVQRPYLHITDTAALVGCAPRDSLPLLADLRRGTLEPGWSVESFPTSAGEPVQLPTMVATVQRNG